MKSMFPFGLWIPFALLVGVLLGGCSSSVPAKCAETAVALSRERAHRVANTRTPRVSKFVRLQHARAGEVAATLRRLDRGARSLFDSPILATAYHHGNALVLVGTARDVAKLLVLVRKLDTPRRSIRLKAMVAPRFGREPGSKSWGGPDSVTVPVHVHRVGDRTGGELLEGVHGRVPLDHGHEPGVAAIPLHPHRVVKSQGRGWITGIGQVHREHDLTVGHDDQPGGLDEVGGLDAHP
jgi:hypothetical protein